MSREEDVISGVPQGTVLAAMRFFIMISDIDENVKECIVRSFADDTRVNKKIRNENDKELMQIVDNVIKACEICQGYKKTPPRPVVGLPLASNFNETVCLDLITIKQGTWIVHLIDAFSRYSAACVRHS